MPRFYFDMAQYRHYYDIGQPPYTPALSVIFALDLALERIVDEGMDSVFERHARIGRMTRDGVRALGLSVFPDEKIASNTVTAVKVPPGVDATGLLALLREEHGVVLAGGQGSLSGKILRIGHMGHTTEAEIQHALNALAAALPAVGFTATRAGTAGK
jgi:aspartate aminotransferase-like enzyme